MKRYIKASSGLTRYFTNLTPMRSIMITDGRGRTQKVTRYVDPSTNESFALLNAGDDFQVVKIEKSGKTWQVVDIIDSGEP